MKTKVNASNQIEITIGETTFRSERYATMYLAQMMESMIIQSHNSESPHLKAKPSEKKRKRVYINKKERQALHDAWEQVNNVLENCDAGNDSWIVKMLNRTLEGLASLEGKKPT